MALLTMALLNGDLEGILEQPVMEGLKVLCVGVEGGALTIAPLAATLVESHDLGLHIACTCT
jgi:hypothetical protein